ncbi:MAG: polysaccharide biosynthesis tyrosine autokinase [Pseudomonadota bacterium]|nr:polysaccharide biosynthesis tyrosine autokinase [Pseudomonadota bacterium]
MPNEFNDRNDPALERRMAVVRDRRELDAYYGGGYLEAYEEPEEDAINLREYWNIIRRRKWTIILFLLIAVTATVIGTFLQTPIYRSSLTLKIDRETPKIVEYQSVAPDEGTGWNDDFYQTQYELLQSRTLARRVADELGLAKRLENQQASGGSLLDSIKGLFKPEAPEDDTPDEPADASWMVSDGLSVVPVRNSRLVTLNFDGTDPVLATRILNTLADAFVKTSLERRFEATIYAKKFLEERIEQVRANLEDSEAELARYTTRHGIVDVEKMESILQAKLMGLSQQLVNTESQRIALESEFQQMNSTDGELIRTLDNPVIQGLKSTLAGLESEYQENRTVFKPAYPKMEQLQASIDRVQQKIDAEMDNVEFAVRQSYLSKVREQAAIEAGMNQTKDEILGLREHTTDFKALQREVHTNRELFEGLLQRMKEVGVVAGVGTNNISVVDPAEVPKAQFKPNLQKNLLLAIVLGLMGGIGLAFLFEHLDDTIKSSQDMENLMRKPVLGIVPLVKLNREDAEEVNLAMLTHDDPRSGLAEAFRSLRTSLQFSTADGAPKLLHFTSSGPAEGKTTSAINTAIACAQTGSTVLLVDADLRNPSLHKEFGLPNTHGLTHYLAGTAKPAEITQATDIPNLFVITSGPQSPNPAELLGGAKMADLMKLSAERFANVILDGPPVLGLADALILGNVAQASVVVVEAAVTRKNALEAALKRLNNVQTTVIGGILTKYGQGSSGYGYDYDYNYRYNYYYGYGNEVSDETPKEQLAS